MATLAILPVKRLDFAKQRLDTGLAPEPRRALAEAMLADVLVALRRTAGVDDTLVVTSDRNAQQLAEGHGATVLADDGDRGHNQAASCGVQRGVATGFDRVLLVPGDCPLLDPAELDALLGRDAPPPSVLVVPDRHGTGTNALLLTPPDALSPAFGPGSRDRHIGNAQRAGVLGEVVEVASLALDVDTPEDLQALRSALATTHGGAARTRGLLTQLQRSGS
jgi:2-phospho-L-lactate guanylyltransferase